MSTSKIPASLSALVVTITAALPDWSVTDGAALSDEPAYCTVGYDPQDDSVSAAQTPSNLGLGSQAESFDVRSVLSTWSGDVGMADVRAAVYTGFDSISDALAVDPTLGGVVSMALLTSHAYTQEATAESSLAQIRFTIHIEAWR